MATKYGHLLRLQDTSGPKRSYSITVPYSEIRTDGKVTNYEVVQKVRASSLDDAIDEACHALFESMVSAELRGDIKGWNMDKGKAHEYKPKSKCA